MLRELKNCCLAVSMRQSESIISPSFSLNGATGGGGGGAGELFRASSACPQLHVDIHGAAGSDIDVYVGLGAMEKSDTHDEAPFRERLATALTEVLGPHGYVAGGQGG